MLQKFVLQQITVRSVPVSHIISLCASFFRQPLVTFSFPGPLLSCSSNEKHPKRVVHFPFVTWHTVFSQIHSIVPVDRWIRKQRCTITLKFNIENIFIEYFTAPFNRMQTLKFKIQPTVTLSTAINHCNGPLRKRLAQQGQKVMFLPCDWQTSNHFLSFCIFTHPPPPPQLSVELWLTARK